MFHTIINLAYIIPNIYVFMRIWQLFINKGYKLHYTLIYLLFALVYPVSNLFSEESTDFIATIFTTTGNYLLPFYLYLFLSVLVFDIFLLINRLIKIIPLEKFRSTRFKKAGLSVILIFPVLVVIGGIINFNTIRTSEYQIEIPGRSSEIKQLKIAFVADFHLQESTNKKFVERFAKKIADIKPDLMILGGDIVEGDREDENMIEFEKLLREIKARYGTFAVLGNHEFYAGNGRGSFFDKAGMNVLCDTIVVIDGLFSLGGRLDSHFMARRTIDDLMGSAIDTLPMILIDHRPTEIDQVRYTTVDVQLSGHTHNGQLFPINLFTRRVYQLSWGYLKMGATSFFGKPGNTHFFVTSGIRLWGPPVRTTGKSEIMVIDITFTKP